MKSVYCAARTGSLNSLRFVFKRLKTLSKRHAASHKLISQCECKQQASCVKRQAMYVWGAFVQPLCLRKSNKDYILWVCVCSLQHAMRMCSIRLSSVARPLYCIFPHYLRNCTIFKKEKVIQHKMCVLISATTFLKHFTFYGELIIIIIIIVIIIIIYCNWVVTRWQWLCYMYTKHEIGYY